MADPPGPPVCVCCRRQPVDPAWRPFCSRRCKLQDLARWAEGQYRIAGEPQDAADGQRVNPKETENS
jgi:uncharacterized protein